MESLGISIWCLSEALFPGRVYLCRVGAKPFQAVNKAPSRAPKDSSGHKASKGTGSVLLKGSFDLVCRAVGKCSLCTFAMKVCESYRILNSPP